MIPRYTLPEMARVWSEEHRLQLWLKVEVLACEAMAGLGLVPREVPGRLRREVSIDPAQVRRREQVTRHEVVAFLECLWEQMGPEARWLHLGLTSSDLMDTAFAVQLREAADLLLEALDRVRRALAELALRHRDVPMVGRTHGVHAEPITFGLKMAGFYQEMGRHRERLRRAREQVAYGKVSGAVGTYAHLHPQVERYVCEHLGLRPEPISTQVVPRDRHAEYFSALALLAAGLERLAIELRHLQRTEVLEVEEPFGEGQAGSSAMPHKRNPVALENVSGLCRLVRSYLTVALENVALWHERDISHSSVERVIAPDATTALHFALHRMGGILEGLRVYPERMRRNLELTRGLIFSEALLVRLVRAGLDRGAAYRLVQRLAMRAWQDGGDFRELVRADPEVRALLPEEELRRCFDLKEHLRWVDGMVKEHVDGG